MQDNDRVSLVYDLLMETRREMRESFSTLSEKLDNYDKRIRDLENSRAKLYGMSAAAGAAASSLWRVLAGKLRGE